MRVHLILATAALVALSSAHAAEVYRWVDKDGKVVYSDIPPPPGVKNPELRKLGKNAVDVDKTPYATRDAAKKSPVTLYANNCGEPCDKARQLLSTRGIPYSSKNPESSPADADALKKLIGALEVPVLVVGANTVKGFEPGAWESALDAAGYPKTAALTLPPVVKRGAAPKPAPSPGPAPAEKADDKAPAPKY